MKVLILCSGGDAPGMNRFTYTLSRAFRDVYYVRAGFKGLVNGDILPMDMIGINKVKNEAGAFILSSRYPDFTQKKNFDKAVKVLKDYDVLVILGGNGSEQGAKRLFENGVNTIFVPATIDNDVEDSYYSIGFDSAVNQCVYTYKNIMPSIHAMQQGCFFICMGRYSDRIAREFAKRVKSDYLATTESDMDAGRIAKVIRENLNEFKGTGIVVKERLTDEREFAAVVSKKLHGVTVKVHKIGKLQRGGKPTMTEIKMCDKLAEKTIKMIKNKEFGKRVLVDKRKNVFADDFKKS